SQASSEASTQAQQQNSAPGAAEFATPEALLRHDAAQTPVPPQVADRLRASLAAEPVKSAAWWRRLLRR
ncbi:MAG: hypothetical protein RIQ79_1726, partial [Verrucomicrobiota bacterium]